MENFYGVRCDPSVPYVEGFTPPAKVASKRQDFVAVSRRNFVALCEELTATDEKVFEQLWRTLGLSVDWSLTYSTVSQKAQRISQRAFLRNFERGEAYSSDAPSLWDTTFQTAVAQAELEDRDRPAAYHDLRFHQASGDGVTISTTRPELLAACVAWWPTPTTSATSRCSAAPSPHRSSGSRCRSSRTAWPSPTSTGIAMICTFGDTTDVIWWRELELPPGR